eukprot:5913949-Pyramimonas_sp.AAC.1
MGRDRARVFGQPGESVDILNKYVLTPDDICYSTDMESQPNTKALVKHVKLLTELRMRIVKTQGPIVQKPFAAILERLANQRGETWKLADRKQSWARETSKKIRTMLRHVDQGLVKSRGSPPGWLKAYVEAEMAVSYTHLTLPTILLV